MKIHVGEILQIIESVDTTCDNVTSFARKGPLQFYETVYQMGRNHWSHFGWISKKRNTLYTDLRTAYSIEKIIPGRVREFRRHTSLYVGEHITRFIFTEGDLFLHPYAGKGPIEFRYYNRDRTRGRRSCLDTLREYCWFMQLLKKGELWLPRSIKG